MAGSAGHILLPIVLRDSAAPTVTGTSATTLAAFTSSASGTHTTTGSSATTLAHFTSTAAGTYGTGISGTSATTLASFTSSATGSTVTGTSAQTLANFTSSTSGAHGVTGTSARTLSNFTSTASGSSVTGTSARTLSNFTATASGTITYAGVYPTSVSGRLLLDQNGDPWFGVGDTAWSAVGQLTNAEITTYLADRGAKGIKAVIMSAPEPWYCNNAPNNADGVAPFTGTAFQSTLNNTYWNRVDHFVQQALANGITVFMWVAYLGYPGGGDGWEETYSAISGASNANMTTHGGYLAARYGSYPNIVYMAGGDQDGDATTRARMNALMTALGPDLASVHAGPGDVTDTNWGAYSWYNFRFFYDNSTSAPVTDMEGSRADSPTMPNGYGEGRYEYESGSGSGVLHRYQMWAGLLEGGAFTFIGNNPIWFFGSTKGAGFGTPPTAYDTWQEALDSPLSLAAEKLATFVAGYTASRWSTMVPGVSFVTTGEGTTTSKAAVMVDQTNGNAVVYFPTSRSITLTMTVFTPSSIRLRWFDPTNATYTTIGTYPNTGTRSPSYPSNNSLGAADWVLVADDASSTVTGTSATTLAPFTSSATGSSVTGTSARTLAAFTSTASGATGAAGTSAVTLAAFTSTASGTATPPGVSGSSARTLADFTSTASGSSVSGSSSVALAAFTSSASGTFTLGTVTGTSAQTLVDFTSSASGTSTPPTITGTSAVTLAAFTSTATGAFGSDPVGTAAVTLAAFTSTASGTATPPTVTGTSDTTLAPFIAAAVGAYLVAGTVARTLSNFTSSATGTVILAEQPGSLVLAVAAPTLVIAASASSLTITAQGDQ